VRAIPESTLRSPNLREILGDKVYESFARAAESMTITAMATYALAQIEYARTELNAASK
jgi:hypothetical protein